jgi:hypothetical protein
MVLSVKTAARAGYYFQGTEHAGDQRLAGGVWLSGVRDHKKGEKLNREERRQKVLGVITDASVNEQDLDNLLHRTTAGTGEMPVFNLKGGTTGYDFVFSAPKSISILWMLLEKTAGSPDELTRVNIEQAHHRAVQAAAKVLQEHAIRERVGKGGRSLRRAHAAIAAFLHFRCRPAAHQISQASDMEPELFPDPNLHTHVIVPDLVVSSATKSSLTSDGR